MNERREEVLKILIERVEKKEIQPIDITGLNIDGYSLTNVLSELYHMGYVSIRTENDERVPRMCEYRKCHVSLTEKGKNYFINKEKYGFFAEKILLLEEVLGEISAIYEQDDGFHYDFNIFGADEENETLAIRFIKNTVYSTMMGVPGADSGFSWTEPYEDMQLLEGKLRRYLADVKASVGQTIINAENVVINCKSIE